jgi:hypothetical protein
MRCSGEPALPPPSRTYSRSRGLGCISGEAFHRGITEIAFGELKDAPGGVGGRSLCPALDNRDDGVGLQTPRRELLCRQVGAADRVSITPYGRDAGEHLGAERFTGDSARPIRGGGGIAVAPRSPQASAAVSSAKRRLSPTGKAAAQAANTPGAFWARMRMASFSFSDQATSSAACTAARAEDEGHPARAGTGAWAVARVDEAVVGGMLWATGLSGWRSPRNQRAPITAATSKPTAAGRRIRDAWSGARFRRLAARAGMAEPAVALRDWP